MTGNDIVVALEQKGYSETEINQQIIDVTTLVGTQKNFVLPDKIWEEYTWRCPSCKYWFPPDWNHDDEVCCACAGCTKHPYIGEHVRCQCEKCATNKDCIK